MKEDRLESFVRGNKESFDIHSPSPEVWGKLNQQLHKKEQKHWMKSRWLQVAAVLAIVIISSGVIVKSLVSPSDRLRLAADADPEVRELIEAEAYYAQQVSGKLKEIRKCYKLVPELEMEVENDLLELEGMYQELKKDLKENVSNKEVIEAMIENNRFRMKLVDDVLEQINC
ncbi:hypothetical protein ACUNWD_08450 [Sunxiuqinia sp. A32]|uniref:hypothetical protein n=1 Tax=Sunxiuqinia sp. A32 TaxID=3461496 RepID=UPI0040464294